MRITCPDHEEIISAGGAWYMPAGHVAITEDDVENIVFTLAGEYEKVMAAIARGTEPSRIRYSGGSPRNSEGKLNSGGWL
jgi:hypothetical protein